MPLNLDTANSKREEIPSKTRQPLTAKMTPRLDTAPAVRNHLCQYADLVGATQFVALMDNGLNKPMKSTPKAHERFGPEPNKDHVVFGKKLSPFLPIKYQPTAQELSAILEEELQDAIAEGETVWIPDSGQDESDDTLAGTNEALELVQNLADPKFTANGFVASLPCGQLDDMTQATKEMGHLSMTNTPLQCHIMPHNTVLPLQHHNETTSYSTLLLGSIAWIIWPPTEENLQALQQAYDDFAVDFDEAKLDIASKLVGGIFFVQNVGECIRIPPYCIILGLTVQTAVLARYSVLTAPQFLVMLRKIPFLESWWKTEVNGDLKRASFATDLVRQIERILNGEFEDYEPSKFRALNKTSGVLADLVHGWDELSGPITTLVSDASARKLKKAWKIFLCKVVGKQCAICGQHVQIKNRQMGPHFNDRHWPKQKAGEIVPAMNGKEDDQIGSSGIVEVGQSMNIETEVGVVVRDVIAQPDAMEIDR